MPKIQEKRATKKNKSKETYKKYGKYTKRNIRIKDTCLNNGRIYPARIQEEIKVKNVKT